MILNRRGFLTTCGATALFPQGLFAATKEVSAKKGWAGGDASLVEKFGAHWFYNWGPDGKSSMTKEFVPMIKGERDFSKFGSVEGQSGIKHLLGYNEPNLLKSRSPLIIGTNSFVILLFPSGPQL